jgi:hypothetical protein
MTNEEFDRTKLPIRIDFKTSECARLVLVQQYKLKAALQIYAMNETTDLETMREVIEMFRNAKR